MSASAAAPGGSSARSNDVCPPKTKLMTTHSSPVGSSGSSSGPWCNRSGVASGDVAFSCFEGRCVSISWSMGSPAVSVAANEAARCI